MTEEDENNVRAANREYILDALKQSGNPNDERIIKLIAAEMFSLFDSVHRLAEIQKGK